MIRQKMTFAGVDFGAQFHAYLAKSNFLDGASKDVESVQVIGRSGNLQISNDRYNNITLKVYLYVTDNMKENIDAMRNFLESCHGYKMYEETLNPNEHRMASYKQAFVPDVYDVNAGAITLEFDAMPQRYLKVGAEPVEAAVINNPTRFDAYPLIRVYGDGVVNINNNTITVSANPYPYIDIDCGLMDCQYNLNNANQYVAFSSYDYLTLPSGDNAVAYSGNVTKVEITPRWYTL